MTKPKHSRLLQFTGLLLAALVWLANNGNPPTGRTGAPFDSTCSNGSGCHGGSNPNGFDGNASLSGLPNPIQPNTTYPVTITVDVTAGSPTKAGFQVVAVDGNNFNAGDFTNAGTQTGTETLSGREYIEHRNGKLFSGGTVSWNFNWKSPASAVAGNTIKFYFAANFTNNSNTSNGDFPKEFLETYQFEAPPPVTATITSSSNVLCNGGNTGTATAEGGGGVAPYTYLWSNGQNTATAVNLTANTYTVTVTGSSNSGSATASVTITQPTALSASASVSGVLTCANTSVTATATASGGTPGYEFTWSNGQTGNQASFDSPGTYTVTATDNNGCTKVASVTVTENVTPPNANVAPGGTLTCITPQLTLSGAGSSTGPNYVYLWTATNGGNIVSGGTTLTPTINSCGTYTLQVTNTTNGCTATASTSVNCEIDPPNISVGNNGPLTCATTIVTLSGNSTTGGVTYSWTGPNGFTSNQQNPSVSAPGSYVLTVLNPANSCSNTASTTVNQNIVPPTDTARVADTITCVLAEVEISMSTNIQNGTFQWTGPNGFTSTQKKDTIAVPGDYIGIVTNPANGCKSRDTVTVIQNTTPPGASATADGGITCTHTTVQLTGGPSGYSYLWKGPNLYTSMLQNPVVTLAGPYTLVVTSAVNGCTSTASVNVSQNTTAPTASIAPPTNLNCNNTTVQLNATGSSQGANFSYLWSTPDGHIESGATTLTPVVDAAGTYNLVVTNTDNGCTSTAATTVSQTPPVQAGISSSSNVSCNGGSNGEATAAGTGGNGAYTYLWSNGATTATVTGLAAGIYIVSVTDGENCSATAMATITQPEVLAANASATGETSLGADNGTATATPAGGTPNYTYSWSNGGTTATITGLAPGSYTVSVQDANGCSVVQTVTVNAFGCSLAAGISSTNATCFDADNGTAAVTVTGAADPVTYNWSNGATTQSISGLAPGNYSVSIMDANNCPAVLNTSITEPTAVSANATATNETVAGAGDGTTTATPTGGTGSYTYLWSGGATTSTVTGLVPGTYTVSVTDSNNCTAVQSVTVSSVNCAVTASITGADVSCFDGSDGQATGVLTGGQLPISYQWTTGATTATITNLLAGIYTVMATDAAGCVASATITINQPTALQAQITNIQNVECGNDLTGAVSITASGGTAPYDFQGSMSNLGVGMHTVDVVDANGCKTSVSFSIVATDAQPPVVVCPGNIILCGADIVSYPAPTATDNCGPIGAPVLVSGQPSGSAFNDGTTVQVFRATDANGNSATCSFSVIVHPLPDILLNGSTDDHNGQGVGTISITAVGGGGGYLYTWNKNGQFFSNSEDLTGLNAGSYTLTVSDGNGCTVALAPVIINNTVGLNELDKTGVIRLYPNPATNFLNLETRDIKLASGQILDTKGRLVAMLDESNLGGLPVSIETLASGLYFMRLSTENGSVVTLKFFKSE